MSGGVALAAGVKPELQAAVVLDFDGTLAPDSSQALVQYLIEGGQEFWNEVNRLTTDGWDPPLAWITKLLAALQSSNRQLGQEDLRRVATGLHLYDGVPQVFCHIKDVFERSCEKAGFQGKIGFHIVSGGLEDLILETPVGKHELVTTYGCQLDWKGDKAIGPKSVISFTEKTKFLYAINKGISKTELRENPQIVNHLVPRTHRPVPFANMIYIGDGPTDIPCFSAITQQGGAAIGIMNDEARRQAREAEQLGKLSGEPRLWNYRPRWGPFCPDYRTSRDCSGDSILVQVLEDLLSDIVTRAKGRD